MLGGVERESSDVIRFWGVSNEAASGVTVKGEQEKKSEVVCVPECFEALVADLMVGGCVH